jgi:hypothetical protein
MLFSFDTEPRVERSFTSPPHGELSVPGAPPSVQRQTVELKSVLLVLDLGVGIELLRCVLNGGRPVVPPHPAPAAAAAAAAAPFSRSRLRHLGFLDCCCTNENFMIKERQVLLLTHRENSNSAQVILSKRYNNQLLMTFSHATQQPLVKYFFI